MQADAPILTDRTWAAWLAGIMDTEGTFTATWRSRDRINTRLGIRMTSPEVIQRVLEVAGTGQVRTFQHRDRSAWRGGWEWNAYGAGVLPVLCGAILPYLYGKRNQALLMMALTASQRDERGKAYGGTNPRPQALIRYQHGLVSALHILNARGGSHWDGLALDRATLQALLAGPDTWTESGLSVPVPSISRYVCPADLH